MREDFKSGFVTLIGRPNVGKSTLMNHLIGQKIAITSNKPQTTRNRIQTVLTTEEGQIVFVDTPGIHKAKNKLGEYMVNIAERSLNEVDVVLWLVEPSAFIGAGDRLPDIPFYEVSDPHYPVGEVICTPLCWSSFCMAHGFLLLPDHQ